MLDATIVVAGGLLCGVAAGASAQYGRLCTFAAIEDALIGGDWRRARAWALALAVAIAGTQTMILTKALDTDQLPYWGGDLEVAGLVMGSLMFGLGMSLAGTCAFGLLVRAGTGDLRALVIAMVAGITAFAATAGPLSAIRLFIAEGVVIDLSAWGGTSLTGWMLNVGGPAAAVAATVVVVVALAVFVLSSARARRRHRLMISGAVFGLAIAGGWLVTGPLADPYGLQRPESLTFVAPLGRTLMVAMGQMLSTSGFAVASVLGVILGSFALALAQAQFRWEAFDDQREMRRHLTGALLMGFGGVLARGCTIGQGLSAGSTLAVSAPIAIACMVLGARLGLAYLMHGAPAAARAMRMMSSWWASRGMATPPLETPKPTKSGRSA